MSDEEKKDEKQPDPGPPTCATCGQFRSVQTTPDLALMQIPVKDFIAEAGGVGRDAMVLYEGALALVVVREHVEERHSTTSALEARRQNYSRAMRAMLVRLASVMGPEAVTAICNQVWQQRVVTRPSRMH